MSHILHNYFCCSDDTLTYSGSVALHCCVGFTCYNTFTTGFVRSNDIILW